jgi:hypothetical protein
MKLANFAERTHIWPRFRHAMITFWQPLILLATISTIITLAASLPFAVKFILIMPLFGVAAYLAHGKYGVTGLVSVVSVFVLGCFFKLLSSISVIGPIASRNPPIQDRIEGGGGTMVVLIAMIILFAAATYFAGRYGEEGQAGMVTIIVVLVLVAFMLGGLNLG